MQPIKCVESIEWAISTARVPCPRLTPTEVYRTQPPLEGVAQLVANSPKSQMF